MKFIPHPQQSRLLGAPAQWDHSKAPCGSLSIKDTVVGGYPAMESAWAPEGFEGLLLGMGLATVRLEVISRTHPPVAMSVYPKTDLTPTQRSAAIALAISELVEFAKLNGLEVALSEHGVAVFEPKPKPTT